MRIPGKLQEALDAPKQATAIAILALLLAAAALITAVVRTHGA
jgi:hypothetical protein